MFTDRGCVTDVVVRFCVAFLRANLQPATLTLM